MRKAPCADLAELRSAFVDGALNDTDRERLLKHLVDCANCRRDVEDLRAVRHLLNRPRMNRAQPRATYPSAYPSQVRSRSHLVDQAVPANPTIPLLPNRGLPSHRRTVKLRIGASAVALGATVTAMGVIGYAVRPVSGSWRPN